MWSFFIQCCPLNFSKLFIGLSNKIKSTYASWLYSKLPCVYVLSITKKNHINNRKINLFVIQPYGFIDKGKVCLLPLNFNIVHNASVHCPSEMKKIIKILWNRLNIKKMIIELKNEALSFVVTIKSSSSSLIICINSRSYFTLFNVLLTKIFKAIDLWELSKIIMFLLLLWNTLTVVF